MKMKYEKTQEKGFMMRILYSKVIYIYNVEIIELYWHFCRLTETPMQFDNLNVIYSLSVLTSLRTTKKRSKARNSQKSTQEV
jgi:hypothetical protein